jgi:hypothetical protein
MTTLTIRRVLGSLLVLIAVSIRVGAEEVVVCPKFPSPCQPQMGCGNLPDCFLDQPAPCCVGRDGIGPVPAFSDLLYSNLESVNDHVTMTTPLPATSIIEIYSNSQLVLRKVVDLGAANQLVTLDLSALAPEGDFFRIYVGNRRTQTQERVAFGPSLFHVLTSIQGANPSKEQGTAPAIGTVEQVIRLNPDSLETASSPPVSHDSK